MNLETFVRQRSTFINLQCPEPK
uniref:Uncharacterized protein n=1 Tax=Anguilla anguilla TaxID=7936 RepID=A0A0E9U8R6_ANGAN